jgi:hypothetical protein
MTVPRINVFAGLGRFIDVAGFPAGIAWSSVIRA